MEVMLLMRMEKDQFGDTPNVFVPVSWTDDLREAQKWRDSSTMLEIKKFFYLPKHTPKP